MPSEMDGHGMPNSLEEVSSSDSSDVHVLAVDDNVIDRRFVEALLKASAFKVSAVDSGRRALEYLGLRDTLGPMSLGVSSDSRTLASNMDVSQQLLSSSQQVNLIITDYCMPGMTGFDLLKTIKGTSGLKEIPVVIMSSENEPNRISSCLAEGAKDFLLKPVQLADLKRLRVHLRETRSDPDSSQQTGHCGDRGASFNYGLIIP